MRERRAGAADPASREPMWLAGFFVFGLPGLPKDNVDDRCHPKQAWSEQAATAEAVP